MTYINLAISVIVPTYNREDVVLRALKSLINQDVTLDYEIIVVDDGSTDNTINKVESMQQQHDCIRLIKQDNQGASAARRTGILAANADVVAFLDSDDMSEPHHLSVLWNALQQKDSVVMSYGLLQDLQGMDIEEQNVPKVDQENILYDPLCALLNNGCFTYSMNLMTYKKLAVESTVGREHILAANDYDLCLRLALKGEFCFAPIVTIKIERRDDGIGSKFGYRQVSFAVFVAIEAFRESLRKDKVSKQALKNRVQLLWPTAFAQLVAHHQYTKAFKLGLIGIRYGSIKNLKELYWAVDYYCFKKLK